MKKLTALFLVLIMIFSTIPALAVNVSVDFFESAGEWTSFTGDVEYTDGVLHFENNGGTVSTAKHDLGQNIFESEIGWSNAVCDSSGNNSVFIYRVSDGTDQNLAEIQYFSNGSLNLLLINNGVQTSYSTSTAFTATEGEFYMAYDANTLTAKYKTDADWVEMNGSGSVMSNFASAHIAEVRVQKWGGSVPMEVDINMFNAEFEERIEYKLESDKILMEIDEATGGVFTLSDPSDGYGTNYVMNPTIKSSFNIDDSRWVGDMVFNVKKNGANNPANTSLSDDVRKVSKNGDSITVSYDTASSNTYGIKDFALSETYTLSDDGKSIDWTIDITNTSGEEIEICDIGLPLLMNSWWQTNQTGIYEQNVARHSFVAKDGSYIYWQRPNGDGSFLVMVPKDGTGFEFKDKARYGDGTFAESDPGWEGLVEYYIHSKKISTTRAGAYLPATSLTLANGESETYGFTFCFAQSYEDLRDILYNSNLLDAVTLPGMVIPNDMKATLALRCKEEIASVTGDNANITYIRDNGEYKIYEIEFTAIGENYVTVTYGDGKESVLQYYSTLPIEELVDISTDFIVNNQQAKTTYSYNGAYLQWDMSTGKLITWHDYPGGGWKQWMAGGSDDLGLSPAVYISEKNIYDPDKEQIESVEYYLENFIWGYMQQHDTYKIYRWYDGSEGTPSDTGTWRSYNYVHVANTYFNMYKIASRYPEMVTYLTADEYLLRAYNTLKAYFTYGMFDGSKYENGGLGAYVFGNMGEHTLPDITEALGKEGYNTEKEWLEAKYYEKAYNYIFTEEYPFASEMSIDTTGFETCYTLAKMYGNDELAHKVTKASMASRGIQPLWYFYGSDNRHMGESWWNLGYETHLGAWQQQDYLLNYVDTAATDFDDMMRVTYGAYLGGWANINAGQISENSKNYGAYAWTYQSEKGTSNYSHIPSIDGWWAWSGEGALGFWGGLKTASVNVVEDSAVGLYGYGCDLTDENGSYTIVPKDGVRQRLTLYNKGKFGFELDSVRYTKAVVKEDLTSISLEIEDGDGSVTLFNLPEGSYTLECDGSVTEFSTRGSEVTLNVSGDKIMIERIGDVDNKTVWHGEGYSFTGTGGVTTDDVLPISGNNPFTVEAVVTPGENKEEAGYGYGRCIVSWGESASNKAFFLYYNSDQEVFEYGFYGKDGETAPLFPKNKEYKIALTYDSDLVKVYVNNTLIAQRAIKDVDVSATKVTVGTDAFGQGKHFTGEIESIAISNYAKSPEELGIIDNEHLTPLKHVYSNDIEITSDFWNNQIKRMTEKWLPHCISQLETVAYGLNAFVQTANKLNGKSYTAPSQLVFTDAYTYNTIEAMCLALTFDPGDDEELKQAQDFIREKLDEWIPVVLSAQEDDGYINTNYTLRDKTRWSEKTDHEGYVMGYFIEAAIALYELTDGEDTRLYDAAIKTADLWVDTIGPSPKKHWYDGHQEMEIAMMRLGRFVNEKDGEGAGDKYIALAQYLCDTRGSGSDYDQSHLSATEQSEAVGHSVRATYQYTGMTDIAMETGNDAYYAAIERLWDSTVNTKMYVTGGIGSISSNEGFTTPYTLPNKSYNESCASCGMMFWANRMNMAYHDASYIDNLERQLYNVVLGAVNLDGNAYYYQNELDANWSRYSWHECPCCIGNVPRTIYSIMKWAYATEGDDLYVNMLVGSSVTLDVNGTDIEIVQDSDYPWKGYGKITLNPEYDKEFTVKVRMPEFKETSLYDFGDEDIDYIIRLNGEIVTPETDKGYAVITKTWTTGDTIEIEFPMDIKVITADSRIEADRNRVAVQRGPIVYNFEDADNSTFNVASIVLDTDEKLTAEWEEDLLEGVMVIKGSGVKKTANGLESVKLTAIPNFARLNRGGRSIVWVAEADSIAETDSGLVSTNKFTYHGFGESSGKVKISYTLTPFQLSDGIVGFTGSNVTPSDWNHFPVSIRIQPDGTMDARNGSAFDKTNSVTYTANKSYEIDIEVNTESKTYSVWVTDENGTRTLLADNFAFRTDAPEITDLDKVVVRGGSGVSAGLFKIDSFSVKTESIVISDLERMGNELTFKLTSFLDKGYDVFVAEYNDENIVTKVQKETIPLTANIEKDFSFEVSEGASYKIMVWDEGTLEPEIENISE